MSNHVVRYSSSLQTLHILFASNGCDRVSEAPVKVTAEPVPDLAGIHAFGFLNGFGQRAAELPIEVTAERVAGIAFQPVAQQTLRVVIRPARQAAVASHALPRDEFAEDAVIGGRLW